MKYVRLHADKNGNTHIDDAVIKLDEADYRPPAPVLFVSHAYPSSGVQFIRLPAGWTAEFRPGAEEAVPDLPQGSP